MERKLEIQDLAYNNRDKVTSVIKGVTGAIPIAGPMISEILGSVIPQQRLDRVIEFSGYLEESIIQLGMDIENLQEKLNGPEYSSFFYKSCICAADSTTHNRVSMIRNVFIKGITDINQDVLRYESVLTLLNKLNEIEFTYLYMYHLLKWDIVKFKEYQSQNGGLILYPTIVGGMSQEEKDKENAKLIYSNNLLSLGLLEMEYDKTGKGKYKCSQIGDMLIRYVNGIEF